MYRVIIAEDEMLVRLGLRGSIRWDRFGMEVIADVPNGQEALDVYRREKPDVIITDLRMPVMDGMTLIRSVREHDPDTKIIILTCVEEFETVRQAMRYGVREYILKLTMTPTEMEEVLERVASELQRSTNQLPATPSVNQNLVIEKLFKDYMFRQLYSAAELAELLRRMDRRKLHDRGLQVLVMEIGGYGRLQERLRDEKGDLAKFTLLNVLAEVFEPFERGELFHDERNRFIAILGFSDLVSEQKQHAVVLELTQKWRHTLRTLYGVPVYFSVSGPKNGFVMLPSLYRAAMKGLGAVFVSGADRLTAAAPDDGREPAVLACKLRQLEDAGAAFPDTPFRGQIRVKIDAFLQNAGGELPGRKELVHFLQQLTQLPVHFFKLRSDGALSRTSLQVHEQLEAADTLDEAIAFFSAYVLELASLYEARRTFASKEVTDAVNFIGRNCQRDLSLKEIADEVGMSPNYFSTLFAKETGHGVIDYIHLQRIEKAKRLLGESRLKSYEVAAQVGFTDHSYFSKVFKKLTGFNPREYRRHLSGADAGEIGEEDADHDDGKRRE